jgi:hypothetical protein
MVSGCNICRLVGKAGAYVKVSLPRPSAPIKRYGMSYSSYVKEDLYTVHRA